MEQVTEKTQSKSRRLESSLDGCSTPHQIRVAIEKDVYYTSRICINIMKRKIKELIEKSISNSDIESYEAIIEDIETRITKTAQRITQERAKKANAIADNKMFRESKILRSVHVEKVDGLTLEVDIDKIQTNAVDKVNRQLFLQAYNELNGSHSALARFLGISTRTVSLWKRKYINIQFLQ